MASPKAARQFVCGNEKQDFLCAIPLRVMIGHTLLGVELVLDWETAF